MGELKEGESQMAARPSNSCRRESLMAMRNNVILVASLHHAAYLCFKLQAA